MVRTILSRGGQRPLANIDAYTIHIVSLSTYFKLYIELSFYNQSLNMKLQVPRSQIESILSLTGSVGASIGILQEGVSHSEHFGFRNHALSKAPDGDTLYNIGSLTKSMIAATVGSLVAEGKIQWTTPICDIIPEFRIGNRSTSDQSTFIDLLSHRSGLPTANVLWYQGGSKTLVEKSDLLPMVNGMTTKFPIRDGWSYSNWGYSLVAEAIQHVSNEPWQLMLERRIFDSLEMVRSRTDPDWRADSNIAEGFSGMLDSEPLPVTSQDVNDGTIMGPAGGVCSSTKELLIYYKALMDSLEQSSASTSPSNVNDKCGLIAEADNLFASHATIYSSYSEEATYGLGLLRSRLPGKLGIMSDNSGLAEMPLIGKGTPSQTIFNHAGTLSGFYSSVYLLPETKTCVVVLVNSKPICDSAD